MSKHLMERVDDLQATVVAQAARIDKLETAIRLGPGVRSEPKHAHPAFGPDHPGHDSRCTETFCVAAPATAELPPRPEAREPEPEEAPEETPLDVVVPARESRPPPKKHGKTHK